VKRERERGPGSEHDARRHGGARRDAAKGQIRGDREEGRA